MSQTTRQFWISGRVQGVWFRGSTQRQAQRLGLTGYAKNHPDGRVEVVASGSEAALNELAQWLKQGPPLAKVEQVTATVTEPKSFQGFLTE